MVVNGYVAWGEEGGGYPVVFEWSLPLRSQGRRLGAIFRLRFKRCQSLEDGSEKMPSATFSMT